MKRKINSPLTDALRQAIVDSGLPTLQIANGADITRACLIRFIRGERSLRLDNADRLAVFFRLELKPTKRKGK